jgi:hypothetical protein
MLSIMRYKPSKIIVITAATFALLHIVALGMFMSWGGEAAMLPVIMDYPVYWLLGLFGVLNYMTAYDWGAQLVVSGIGGTLLYAAVGVFFGWCFQSIYDA